MDFFQHIGNMVEALGRHVEENIGFAWWKMREAAQNIDIGDVCGSIFVIVVVSALIAMAIYANNFANNYEPPTTTKKEEAE